MKAFDTLRLLHQIIWKKEVRAFAFMANVNKIVFIHDAFDLILPSIFAILCLLKIEKVSLKSALKMITHEKFCP